MGEEQNKRLRVKMAMAISEIKGRFTTGRQRRIILTKVLFYISLCNTAVLVILTSVLYLTPMTPSSWRRCCTVTLRACSVIQIVHEPVSMIIAHFISTSTTQMININS